MTEQLFCGHCGKPFASSRGDVICTCNGPLMTYFNKIKCDMLESGRLDAREPSHVEIAPQGIHIRDQQGTSIDLDLKEALNLLEWLQWKRDELNQILIQQIMDASMERNKDT